MVDNEEFTFANGSLLPSGLSKIQTSNNNGNKKQQSHICYDDNAHPVKTQNLDEFHYLQKKRFTPTTPIKEAQGAFEQIHTEERQKQDLQYISASLGYFTRETIPKVRCGDLSRKVEAVKPTVDIPSLYAPQTL
ncbi:hypothetical protein KI387_043538 [Taxus chinensis]|uniref:Uncharacterized protein n=1 Tax=Taxus chinensis TaxID=29808 RepID=A0AA38C7U5_TAXCH|nr:hypothetical protein KI387_043538 [Taxus chinensis]